MPASVDLQRIPPAQPRAFLGLTLVLAMAWYLPSDPAKTRHSKTLFVEIAGQCIGKGLVLLSEMLSVQN